MRTVDFDYDLPSELIAQTPIEPRDAARLMLLDRTTGEIAHRVVRDLPSLLRPGDLLVVNRSRVLPARVRGQLRGGGKAEVLLLRKLGEGHWETLARPARRLRVGDCVAVADGLNLLVVAAGEHGIREIRVHADGRPDVDAALLAAGSTPLPPYIAGSVGDPDRYQTIFADVDGSAAAPTAGLHFTHELTQRLQTAGIGRASIILHIGLDTFRPLLTDDPAHHRMHNEWFEVPPATRAAIDAARGSGGRVVAVGTTVVRALETWAATDKAEGWTDLFVRPGYRFRVVDAMLTNFHLPRSTLLMLVSAFAGRERILGAYSEAVRERYRFFSFGDAMFIYPGRVLPT